MTSHEIRIIAGGRPGAAEAAAIAEAVTQAMGRTRRSEGDTHSSDWSRAARLESVGQMIVRARATLPPI